MSKTEWDFWTLKPDLRGAGMDDHMKELLLNYALKNLPPLRTRMELIEGEKEIVPGVHWISAPGHTPGHFALVFSSANEQLLHMAETVLHPMHLEHPAWRTVFNLDQEDAASTRRRLLDRAAAD
jgi:glyoxylase-like metal-dependent hydrolase (beta-lactamase superfamily II)